jgi:hypothetical protein
MTDLDRMMEVARKDLAAASTRDDCKYKPGGVPGELALSGAAVAKSTREVMLADLVRKAGGMTRAQMVDASGITKVSIGYVIQRAKQMGLIHIEKGEGAAIYQAKAQGLLQ